MGSTLAWLYPSSTQGNPLNRCARPSSVATQTNGAPSSAADPNRATVSRTTMANSAGKSARYATSKALTSTATHVCSPPYTTMTRVIQ